jgi:plasmid maintenance system antidote protein VapI
LNNVPKLLDILRERFKAKSDAALARALEVDPSVISKLRGGGPLGNTMVVRIAERTELSIKEIRQLAA